MMKNNRSMSRLLPVIMLGAVLLAEQCAYSADRVTLRLDQPTKTNRIGLPVSGGLPFAKGKLGTVNNLRLLNAAGRDLPLQARALSLWPDGSVKAAMLDFQTDIPADKDTFATLEYGTGVTAVPRNGGIQIKKDGDTVAVDTGTMKFSISKTGCGWMDEVAVDGKVVGKGINFARFKGDVTPNKATVTDITIEEGGDIPSPLRAVIKVEGIYEGHLRTPFTLRIHVHAGKSFVRVFHSLVYAGNRYKEEDHLTELEIGIELAGGAKKILYGIEGSVPIEPRPTGDAAVLFSKDDLNYTITGSTVPALPTNGPSGWWMDPKGKPAGWMSVSGESGNIQMGVRDMWQNYPKGLRVEGNRATLALWPKEHAPFDLKSNHRFFVYDSEKGKDKGGKPGSWNDEAPELDKGALSGMHSGNGKGAAKTHELYFNFQSATETAKLTAAFAAFQEPTYLFAGVNWYADSRILNPYNPAGLSYSDSNLEQWDKAIELSARWVLFAPRYWRWYGMWDYGELVMCGPSPHASNLPEPRFPSGPRPPAAQGRWDYDWRFKGQLLSNCHYDLIEAMLLHYMRTGNRDYFRFAEISAMHVNEVDSQYPFGETKEEYEAREKDGSEEDWGWGRQYGHTSRHAAGNGQASGSHSFLRFRMPLYYLTGNERVKDSMRLAYEFTRDKRAEIFGNGVTIRNVACATKIMETWWSMAGGQEAGEHVKFILHYWVSRQQTKGDLGNFVGINRTWGKGKTTSPEAFNPYNIKMDGPNEIPDPNDWTEKKTIGWRLSEFGTTEAMMDWYNLTGDEKVGQSVVRFIRATKLHGSFNNWYKGQQMLAFAWRLTKDETFRDWLRKDMQFNEYGALGHGGNIELKERMNYEDFAREFGKFSAKGPFQAMHFDDECGPRILMQPYAQYAFDPYDRAFSPATSVGKSPASKSKDTGKSKSEEGK